MNAPKSGTWTVIDNRSEFQKLLGEWDELVSANEAHRPFQAWGWVNAWLDHLAGPHTMRFVCRRSETRQLEFVLPLVESTGNGRYRGRRYFFACGYGPDCSDHCSALRLPSLESSLADLVAEAILHWCDPAIRLELNGIDGANDFPQALYDRFTGAKRIVRLNVFEVCPAVTLPDSWDKFLSQLSSNFRSQVRRYYKRIVKDEHLTFETIDAANAETFTRELIRLNRSRIGSKGKESSLESEEFRSFLLQAVPNMASAGYAWLDVVKHGSTIVAASLNLVHGHTVYFYMGGFDAVAKNARPGTALFAHIIARGIEQEYSCYDFLRGAEPYKYRWGGKNLPTYKMDVYSTGIGQGWPLRSVDHLRDGVRSIVRVFRQKPGKNS